MIVVKNARDLKCLRRCGRIAAMIRDKVAACVGPGTTTGELSDYARELIVGFGAESAFLGYRGYPGVLCISVNEEVVHGIPGERRIEIGDVVSIDVGVKYDGYIGDTATTVIVGVTDQDVIRLVRTTEDALEAGIAKAQVGGRLSDISHAIAHVAEKAGFSVVRDFVGHGIGRQMHEDPQIPNFGDAGKGPRLKEGMTFCLEPMINMGESAVRVLDDGWTVVTRDGMASAHSEHMIAITDGAAEVLTAGE